MPQHEKKWLIFLTIAMGVFMSTMDSGMVNIALPSIMAEFHSPLKKTQWVVSVYLLTITASLLLWGSLADRLGKGRIYAHGVLVFTLGACFSAYSPSLPWLIASRLAQAVGSAMIMATGPAIIREAFPAGQLGRSLGLIGVAVSLGLMIGPTLSGAIIEHFSWRAVFAAILPVGLFLSLLARTLLAARFPARKAGRLDWLGGVLWAASLTVLSLVLTAASAGSEAMIGLLPGLLLGATLFVLLIAVERRIPHPLLPLHLFQCTYFSVGVLCAVLSFLMLFAVTLLTPFYLDRIRLFPPMTIGLIMMALPATVLVVAPTAGWLSDSIGSRLLTSLGLALNCAGLVLLALLGVATPPMEIALCLAVLGAGQAMFLSPNSASVLGRVKIEYAAAAAAILATARNLGMFLGISLASLVFSLSFRKLTGGLDMRDYTPQHSEAFLTALRHAFLACAGAGMIGVILSPLRGRRDKAEE